MFNGNALLPRAVTAWRIASILLAGAAPLAGPAFASAFVFLSAMVTSGVRL